MNGGGDRRRPWGYKPSAAAPDPNNNLKMVIPRCENFSACYMELCKQQRLRPLPIICLTLPHTLNFTTDRVKMDDWGPILNSLSLDRSLKTICIKSKFQCRKPLEEVNSEQKARALGKAPVVLSRYLLEWLSHSIAQCIRNSATLTSLQLEGVPLPPDCLAALCVGLASTQTLKHLSLQRCYIGDNSCALVCRTIIDVQSIKTLNLSQCDLSSSCGPAIAAALSRQRLLLFHESWKDSLRYRDPDFEAMPGLRRLTLNGNPRFGDSAVAQIFDAVIDSLWFKAIDLQHCGITDDLAVEILYLLEHNTTLEVVDVRSNSNLSSEVMDEVFRMLEVNHSGTKSKYRFLNPKKDHRAASAGIKHRKNPEEIINLRPKSALISNTKKHIYQIPINKIPPESSSFPRRPKTKPPIPIFRRQRSTMTLTEQESLKVHHLHLDLQEQIQSVLDESKSEMEPKEIKLDNEDKNSEEDKDKILKDNEDKILDVDLLSKQLEDLKKEQQELMEKIEHSELELNDERSRRMAAESKLQAMKDDLEDLEGALKAKEFETRGYLLVKQQSLDEISESFEKLLSILDDFSRNPNARWREGSSEDEETESIKRKFSLLIRKTKSESLRKTLETPTPKFAKSTGDIRTDLPLVRFEKDVGDAANLISPSLNERQISHAALSCNKRARKIFAQLVNSDLMLNLGSRVS